MPSGIHQIGHWCNLFGHLSLKTLKNDKYQEEVAKQNAQNDDLLITCYDYYHFGRSDDERILWKVPTVFILTS